MHLRRSRILVPGPRPGPESAQRVLPHLAPARPLPHTGDGSPDSRAALERTLLHELERTALRRRTSNRSPRRRSHSPVSPEDPWRGHTSSDAGSDREGANTPLSQLRLVRAARAHAHAIARAQLPMPMPMPLRARNGVRHRPWPVIGHHWPPRIATPLVHSRRTTAAAGLWSRLASLLLVGFGGFSRLQRVVRALLHPATPFRGGAPLSSRGATLPRTVPRIAASRWGPQKLGCAAAGGRGRFTYRRLPARCRRRRRLGRRQ